MASPLLLRTEGDLDHHQDTPPWPSATTFDHHSTKGGRWSYAGKTSLWHGPGFLSLVPDYRAPGSPMAGQRPRRPRRHRQPRALGLGGAAQYAAGGQPFGRP